MRYHYLLCFLAWISLVVYGRVQCLEGHDYRSNPNSGWLVTDVKITGTQALDSAELITLGSLLAGSCVNQSSEEVEERIEALFNDRGYFAAKVHHLEIKPGDPLGQPQPVAVEADVQEGSRYRLASIQFSGNHAFNDVQLRQAFPLKKGDIFQRVEIATGLDRLRDLYTPLGFLDFYMIPDTQLSASSVLLRVKVVEGPQYRMGKLEIVASKELSERLRAQWQLEEGTVFDYGYPEKFMRANQTLLPLGFTRQSVQLVRDCPRATVAVRVLVDGTLPAAQSEPKGVECEQGSTQ